MRTFYLFLLGSVVGLSSLASDKYEIQASHPRIILTKEAELSIRFLLLESENAREIESALRRDADLLLNEKAVEFGKGMPTKEASGKFMSKVSSLALAYRLFEDDKYADKAIELLLPLCNMESWIAESPEIAADFIATAAIGYDWMYYYLNREVREKLLNSIVRKGLYPGLKALEEADESGSMLHGNPQYFLLFSSALAVGALSVGDLFPDLKNKVIFNVLVGNQNDLENISFSDKGNKYGSDWGKNIEFLAMMLASFNASLGHDFNISNLPAMKNFAADYVQHGKSLSVDPGKHDPLNPALLYFGKINNSADVTDFYFAKASLAIKNTSHNPKLNYICLPWLLE